MTQNSPGVLLYLFKNSVKTVTIENCKWIQIGNINEFISGTQV